MKLEQAATTLEAMQARCDAAGIDLLCGAVPDDVEEAYQAMYLVVMRHRFNGWKEISQNAMVNVLYLLQRVALLESEAAK